MTMIDALEPCPDCGSHHHKSCRTINARQKAEHKLNLELQKLLLRKKAMPPINKPNAPGEGSELPALEPYYVEVEDDGCEKCNHGKLWNVVYRPDDIRTATSYGNQEEAEEIVDLMNSAFAKGKAALSSPQQEWIEITPEMNLDSGMELGRYMGTKWVITRLENSAKGWTKIQPNDFFTHCRSLNPPAPPVTAEGKDRG